ncbi:MAG: hypothetical protein HY814_05140 [Candidatus Riflebacteria bacterium]|nr:hypothetical protein [Candidatus Riflebacteria bacterium]
MWMRKTLVGLGTLVALLSTACSSNLPQNQTFATRADFERTIDQLRVSGTDVPAEWKAAIKEASREVCGAYINRANTLLRIRGDLADGITKKYFKVYMTKYSCRADGMKQICQKVVRDLIKAGENQGFGTSHNNNGWLYLEAADPTNFSGQTRGASGAQSLSYKQPVSDVDFGDLRNQ